MTKIAELKKRLMKSPEFAAAYAEADDEYSLMESLIEARAKARLSQTELAEKLGTTQSAIARLEGGGVTPTLKTLRRYAEATGMTLKVELVASK
jgi:predicted transcriptional regulator